MTRKLFDTSSHNAPDDIKFAKSPEWLEEAFVKNPEVKKGAKKTTVTDRKVNRNILDPDILQNSGHLSVTDISI